MQSINPNNFIEDAEETLLSTLVAIDNLPSIPISSLLGNTALICIDMNNGFCKQGLLYNNRMKALIPKISEIAHIFDKIKELPILLVTNFHQENDLEFNIYPRHCVIGTAEAEIVDELKDLKNFRIIGKNCTNSLVINPFIENIQNLYAKGIKRFLVVGGCTDICVYQLCIYLNTFFLHLNLPAEIIVPVSAIDTFDFKPFNHNADLMNIVFTYSMMSNGIKVVKDLI